MKKTMLSLALLLSPLALGCQSPELSPQDGCRELNEAFDSYRLRCSGPAQYPVSPFLECASVASLGPGFDDCLSRLYSASCDELASQNAAGCSDVASY